MLQGDSKDDWNTEVFRMFKGGSLWLPPKKNLYTAGMPQDIFETSLRDHTLGIGHSHSQDKTPVSSSSKSSKSSNRYSKKFILKLYNFSLYSGVVAIFLEILYRFI